MYLYAVLLALILSVTEQTDIKKLFAGNWQLVTYVTFDANGQATDLKYAGGRIMYDEHGNMAAQLMRTPREPLPPNPTPEQRAAASRGYTAYYGKYTIDAEKGSVTHNVLGALNFNVGAPLVRYYKFSEDGSRLMLSIRNAEGRVTGTLTWERLR